MIPFNEYFDTNIEDKIIFDNTLNGIYLLKYISDVSSLDKYIDEYDNIDENELNNKTRYIINFLRERNLIYNKGTKNKPKWILKK